MRPSSRVLPGLLIAGIFASAANAADTTTATKRTVVKALSTVQPKVIAADKHNSKAIINPADMPQAELAPGLVPARVCDRKTVANKVRELRALASKRSPSMEMDCSLTLPENIATTKRLIFKGPKASGVRIEGNGATISGAKGTFHCNSSDAALMVQIVSDECQIAANGEPRCPRPKGITIRNLKIIGSVGISGDAGVPSTDDRFVRLSRINAPANILFDNVTIIGLGLPCAFKSANCNLLYIFFRVSLFKIINPEINGFTSDKAVNIYLYDTSFRNAFRNNTIKAATTTREVIAIDGSSENVFINNVFVFGTLNPLDRQSLWPSATAEVQRNRRARPTSSILRSSTS